MLNQVFTKKGKIKSSNELIQENEEVKRSETSANWKQLAEQTGLNQYLKISECRNRTNRLIYTRDTSVTQEFFCFVQTKQAAV